MSERRPSQGKAQKTKIDSSPMLAAQPAKIEEDTDNHYHPSDNQTASVGFEIILDVSWTRVTSEAASETASE